MEIVNILRAQPGPSHPTPHPVQFFCDQVVTTAIKHHISRPASSPERLQESYSSIEKAAPVWVLLYDTNLLPPAQLNSIGTAGILNEFYRGVCDWIDELAARGVLFSHRPIRGEEIWRWNSIMATPWLRESNEGHPALQQQTQLLKAADHLLAQHPCPSQSSQHR
jgi:hypothetical protein